MLKKGAIAREMGKIEEKIDGGNRPVVNLKYLNQFIPYQLFKMKSLFCLRKLLQEADYMCKLDMKDAHFSVPLHQS